LETSEKGFIDTIIENFTKASENTEKSLTERIRDTLNNTGLGENIQKNTEKMEELSKSLEKFDFKVTPEQIKTFKPEDVSILSEGVKNLEKESVNKKAGRLNTFDDWKAKVAKSITSATMNSGDTSGILNNLSPDAEAISKKEMLTVSDQFKIIQVNNFQN